MTDKQPSKFHSLFVFHPILTAGLLTVSVLPYFGASTHDAPLPALLVEFFAHFRAHYLAVGVVLALAALITRSRASLLMAIFAGLINLFHIAPYYFSDDSAPPGEARAKFTILHANVERGNREYANLLKAIRDRDPDIVFLQEYDEPWFHAVHEKLSAYPYRKYRLGPYFGIGVYSRIKPEEIRVIYPGRARVPSLHLRMRTSRGAILHVLSSHPPPPIGERNIRNRNHQLRELAAYARALSGPVLMTGDLNVSPWSPAFRRFLRESGLRETRGHGIAATWPSLSSVGMIPIDYCLVKGGLWVRELEVLPDTGSDHRPLLCEIRVEGSKGSRVQR